MPTCHATPATATPLLPTAPITPATNVPCSTLHGSLLVPSGTVCTVPVLASAWPMTFGRRSGWVPSTPLSMTATVTLALPVVTSHAAGACVSVCDHCAEYIGSFGTCIRVSGLLPSR